MPGSDALASDAAAAAFTSVLPAIKAPAAAWQWRSMRQWLLLLAGHGIGLVALYSVLYCFGIVRMIPTEEGIMRWDTGWYQSIRDLGYIYREQAQSNVAFFPMMPYVWRLTGLSSLGISVFNMVAGGVGVALLASALQCTRRQGLLLASVPLLMFMLVPYTEALFYLFGAVLLTGLHRSRLSLVLLGLLGCCLTRAAATFFVPALVFAELVGWLDTGMRHTRVSGRHLFLGLLVIALSVGSVMWLQHAHTGEWLGFYKTQRHWNHAWRFPRLPLHTTAGINMLWLDGISISVALASILAGGYLVLRRLPGGAAKRANAPVSKAVLFSLVYCGCVGIFTVFQQDGDLANSSRYVLGTPFFAVLLWAAWQHAHRWSAWVLVGAMLLLLACALGFPHKFEGFWPWQATWYFTLMGCYVAAFLAAGATSGRWAFQRELSGSVYLFNVLFQVFLLNWFLDWVWLG